ncbi:MAG TPA: prepilin peptidase [Terriglobales bacterium]|nr:prepilin peptidase [Terriglobales bacterium]
MIDTHVLGAAVFLFGLVFGSFLNVCIHRLALRCYSDQELSARGVTRRDLSIVSPPSACPKCRHPIRWYDNIPVLSWLLLGGRCRDCRAPISPRYAIVELLTGLLFLACYYVFGFNPLGLKFAVFSFLILGLIFTDAEHKLLPDSLTLTGLALGIGFSFLAPVDDAAGFVLRRFLGIAPPPTPWASLLDAGLGALVGASFIYGAGALYYHARGIEGMGLGDVKLMAMVGAFLGVKLTVLTIFAASLAGTFFGVGTMLMVWMQRTRRRLARTHEDAARARKRAWKSALVVYRRYEMPFGVFLGSMAMLSVFFGESVLRWYLGLYR